MCWILSSNIFLSFRTRYLNNNVTVAEEKKAARCDENRAETQLGETSSDDSDKPGSYDPSLDMPIALRKGTRLCTKQSVCNYISYSSLSLEFKAFTTCLDVATIPKNIYEAMESPKWKAAIME